MSDASKTQVTDAIARYGYTAKAVRALCAANGWRWTSQGASAEWYAAWRDGIGAAFEAIACFSS